jgi:hypothetical protein
MRSIKDRYIEVMGCKLYPGKMYLLEFLNRDSNIEYIFEFDSVELLSVVDNLRIYHRNTWICDNEVYECSGVECLVTLPCGEDIKLSRYRKVIDWDNI